jgi:hypothetical protein
LQLLEVFFDSDVIIDILREYPPAIEWLKTLKEKQAKVSLSGFAIMELIQGCENKEQIKEVHESLQGFHVLWPTESTCSKALGSYTRYHLSHGLGIIDSFIGQMAVDLRMPLHTFNTRHFETIFSLPTVQPYKRDYH